MNGAEIARIRLVSQRLVNPLPSPTDVVRHFGCTQGQDYPGSTVSIALRSSNRSLEEVRTAYDAGEIVRSWPMRGTLFVVPAEDLGWMLDLTGDKLVRSTQRRREQLGLHPPTLDACEQVAREVLSGDGLRRSDLLAAWTDAGLDVDDGRGYHRIFHLALRGVLCQGPTQGREQRFVLNEEWITHPRQLSGDEAVAEWFRRYVRGHGPVPVADFLWWTKLLKRDIAPILDDLRTEFEVLDVDGTGYWVAPDVLEAWSTLRRATAAPLLLPGFDEFVLGYGDRRAVLTREEEARVVPGGNGMFKATLIDGGRAVGTWKRARANAPVAVDPFEPPLRAPLERALPTLTANLPT